MPFAAAAALLVAAGLGGCAGMSDGMSTAFADPAKYELYDCQQLETERKRLATRTAEVQALMAKAETGAAGTVVAELAYRNEYVAVRGQSKFAEDAWQRSRCQNAAPVAAPPVPPVIAPAPQR
ncbi:MAG: twin-arginine translocation pathway signal [Bradyrhizobium sp.]|nr:twin-arginine translocation pathway signal [Bradyrhizobium sp.]MDP3691919.1 twin-arginine translocation pathway signal [Bradyrhizobium sp.]